MTSAVWDAAGELAEALRETPKFQTFRRVFDRAAKSDDFRTRLSEFTAVYSPLRSHPVLLGVRLNQLRETARLLQTDGDRTWLEEAVECGTAFQVVIEAVRSRLRGYPGLRVPHLLPGSPCALTNPFFFHGFPWDVELRQIGLQLQGPPSMAVLGGGDLRTLQGALHAAVRERDAWVAFEAAHAALSEADVRALRQLAKEFRVLVRDDVVEEAAGALSLTRFQYRTAVLEEIVQRSDKVAATYLRAFEDLNELLTVVAAFMETLIARGDLLAVEPHRLALGAGSDLRPINFVIKGGDPMLQPGETLLMKTPDNNASGVVYPTDITQKWARLDDPAGSRMIVSGKLATLL
jgi:hypothetical protein